MNSVSMTKIRKKLDRNLFVIAERSVDMIRLTSYLNTRPKREHVQVTFPANELPWHPFDALQFINQRCWGCAWPFPPSHRIAELFRDCAMELVVVQML